MKEGTLKMTQLLYKKHKLLSKKGNNKGFSLVELIIVIAIMAILVAILAPQYMAYVDKSRQSKDDSNADQLLKAVQVAMSDDSITSQLTADPQLIFDKNGVALTGDTTVNNVGVIDSALQASLGKTYTAMAITSTKYKSGAGHATFTIKADHVTGTTTYSWS